jgi:radical SAM superfamily enzyme YgiQ (UPF0313 family)
VTGGASPDLLLVNPGNRPAYGAVDRSLPAIEPPVWAGLIATFVRLRGHSVEILDANAEGLDPEGTAARVAARRPLLAAIAVYGHNPSASTSVMPAAGAVCRALKLVAPDLPSILAGGHVAALPERTLREEAADFACDGEGPRTIAGLLDLLKGGTKGDYGSVPGLLYREGGAVRASPPAPLITDLDREMPGIAWDLLPMDRYRAHNWHCFGEASRQPYAAIYTSLGCPFHCSFCCIHAPFRSGAGAAGAAGGYRRWSPDAVVGQVDTLVNRYGVRHIKFADEIFVLDRNHVRGICERIVERGYDLNIWAYARVDTIDEEILRLLRRAGVRWLALGIESASDAVREDVGKGYAKARMKEAVAAIRRAGIHVIGNYIFGLPEDDLDTMRETLDLAIELNCEFVNFNCAMAYPGSALYDAAIREGRPLPAGWEGYYQYSPLSRPMSTRHVAGAEVLAFRNRAFMEYFERAAYLEMIRERFGERAADDVRAMLGRGTDKKK